MKKLFQIRVQHDYYQGGSLPCLQMTPTAECSRFMESSGAFYKSTNDGLAVFCDVLGDHRRFLQHFFAKAPQAGFEFLFSIADSDFSKMTEGPADRVCFYVFQSSTVGASEEKSPELKPTIEERGRDRREYDGSVTVSKDQIVNPDFDLLNLTFRLQLNARQSTWRYWVVNRNEVELVAPFVVCDDGFNFDGPSQSDMGNGQNALVFSSNERTFPLSEMPKKRVFLRDRIERSNADRSSRPKPFPLVAELPSAAPGNTNFAPSSDGDGALRPISDIYVYL